MSKGVARGNGNIGEGLPSFMENIHDRNSINMLSKKTLEQNNFSEGQFQSVVSSFDPKKSFRVTQQTFGSPSPHHNSSSMY